ncbi:hypothetical protein CC1G_10307 [Coprinopsis cinerea okayama7|uniref:CBM1 domain-containing protein n=1 Tax=Coprinopsis cinerea (strain Okayama-7 / 130 / ATCC MYA-4618 / FGSC 9003) TaxID=240176 RepID=A8P0G9_COPC7|nr:hypothetical protein CC1G_10307 [Coprinopsis cinerea okayama7\|eukprot:XP_001837886.1 hypothetical protein CC1G_10307 [Coprinopsis cinerea okayama7\
MLKASIIAVTLCAALVNGQATAGPYGQCGGQGWSGPTECTSGYTCTVSNQWYSQCLPGAAPTTVAPPVTQPPVTQPPTGPTPSAPVPAPDATPTLIPGHSFIRAVSAPNFRKYLRSQVRGRASDAVLGEYTEAALFRLENGQLIQNVPDGSVLYAHVEPRTDSSMNKLKVTWETTQATNGRFVWSGDTLEWSSPSVSRPQSNAWLVCPDAQGNKLVYINLGPYGYQTPAGCADQTIHAYTGPIAVP